MDRGNRAANRSLWRIPSVALLIATAAACAPAASERVVQAPVAAPQAAPGPRTPPSVPVPSFYSEAIERGTRSTSGAPGPEYWQNSVFYRIEAELDPSESLVRGSQQVVYRNNSPEALQSIVLNLSQNLFSEGVPRNRYVPVTGGMILEEVRVQGESLPRIPAGQIPLGRDVPTAPAGYAVQGTLGRVRLPDPIASGDSVLLDISWRFHVPPAGAPRTAYEDALGSRAFLIAQWYPQVATFDDLRGWDATPYLGDGEFYLEYGDFDVSITVPAGYLVGATGELDNPGEVLTEEAVQRLAAAGEAETVTRIVTAADLSAENTTQAAIGDQLTWRFTAENVRDFAFATSNGYVWDVAPLRLRDSDGAMRRVAVNALYRPGAPHWKNAVEYGQHSLQLIDGLLIPYLYPQLTIAEGPIGGMEYPMLIFIGKLPTVESLYGVIAHEVAHEWFPMMVGSDEAAYAWMDEGLATFLENMAAGAYFDNSSPFEADLATYLGVAGSEYEVPMMRHTDLVSPYGARVVAAYNKPGVLFRALQHLLGTDVFFEALTTFSSEWLLKHPTPWDLFNTFERVAGRDLDWFFYPWWFGTGVLDHAILSVEGADTGTAVITIEDLGEIPAPAPIEGVLGDGRRVSATVPVETWLEGARTATITLEAPAPIVRIAVDPAQIFPDADPSNNFWGAEDSP